MLSVEHHRVRPSTTSEQKDCQTKMKPGEISHNTSNLSTNNVIGEEESRIMTLERSINFLRCQHDVMLKSLHEEIENLRKTNKALQYRIVMCSCATGSCETKQDTVYPAPQSTELENEIQTLKKLLDSEKRRNQSLLAQMEAMKLARSVVTDDPSVKNNTVSVVQKFVKRPSIEQIKQSPRTEFPPTQSEELTQTDGCTAEQSNTSRSERMLTPNPLNTNRAYRINSPDLQTDGSSSALVINPRAPFTAPDGLWIRQNMPNATDISLANRSGQPNSSGLAGTRMFPIKLPTLRNGKPLSQATVSSAPKGGMNSKIPMNDPKAALPNGQKTTLLQSNESSQAKAARTARGSLGHNSIAVFDPMTEFSSTHQLDMLRPSGRPYTSNLGPFLPALPKTGDAAQVARQRKARTLQRKRLDRVQNLFPP